LGETASDGLDGTESESEPDEVDDEGECEETESGEIEL